MKAIIQNHEEEPPGILPKKDGGVRLTFKDLVYSVDVKKGWQDRRREKAHPA